MGTTQQSKRNKLSMYSVHKSSLNFCYVKKFSPQDRTVAEHVGLLLSMLTSHRGIPLQVLVDAFLT